jgi:hypothetical protein
MIETKTTKQNIFMRHYKILGTCAQFAQYLLIIGFLKIFLYQIFFFSFLLYLESKEEENNLTRHKRRKY